MSVIITSKLSRPPHQFEPFSAHNTAAAFPHSTISSSVSSRQPVKKMTVTQTYRLAHTARGKLSLEASRGDHDLRLLVGHANLLDSLMLDLQEAEREQEAWFNATVKRASSSSTTSQDKPQHIQWQDTIIAERELDIPDASDDEESDNESEFDDEDLVTTAPLRKMRSPPPVSHKRHAGRRPLHLESIYEEYLDDEDDEQDTDEEEDDYYFDDDEDNVDLALVRTQSHSSSSTSPSSPPELVSDNDDSDSDEPTSPPASIFSFADAAAQKPLLDGDEGDKIDQDEQYSSLFDSHQHQMIAAAC